MDETNILTTILLVGIVIGAVAKFLMSNISTGIDKIMAIIANERKFSKKMKELAEMKAKGELHEWISVPTPAGDMLVCKKTGYVPSVDGFAPMQAINDYLAKQKREEEYKEFRNARVVDLAKELGFSLDKMEQVVEKIFSMKKDFAILQIDKLQRELEEKAKKNAEV